MSQITSCQLVRSGTRRPEPLRLVLWDFDGTLVDSSEDVWESLRIAAFRIGRRFSPSFDCGGGDLGLSLRALYERLDPFTDSEELFSVFECAVAHHYRSISTYPSTVLYEGVLDLLVHLNKTGANNRIVTNKPGIALERILSLKGWEALFDGWMSNDCDLNGELSKAQMVERTLEAANVPVSACILVGDSADDIVGAREAGVQSIAVTYGDGDTEDLLLEKPTYIAEDVGELEGLLLGRC